MTPLAPNLEKRKGCQGFDMEGRWVLCLFHARLAIRRYEILENWLLHIDISKTSLAFQRHSVLKTSCG